MIDIKKIEKTIESLEKSSAQFGNIPTILAGVKDIVDEIKEEKINIAQIQKEFKESSEKIIENTNSATAKVIDNTNEISGMINKNKKFLFANMALIGVSVILLILLYLK